MSTPTRARPPGTHPRRRLADDVATALERAGLLPPDRHAEAVAAVSPVLAPTTGATTSSTPLRRRLGEVATYVGVSFVLAAIAVFLAPRWLDLAWSARVGLLAGTAALLAAAGWALARTVPGRAALLDPRHVSRLRLVSVLLTGAAVAASASAGSAVLHQVESSGTEMTQGHRVGLAAALTLAAVAALGYRWAPTLVGHAALAVALAYAVPFTVDELGEPAARPVGLGFLLLGVGWLALAERGVWREMVAGRLVGVAFVLIGAQAQLAADEMWVGYVLTFVVGALGFLLYLTRRAWAYLVLGVTGVTIAVPEALIDWTQGTLGTAAALLAAGLTLLLSGLLAMRLRRDEPA